MIYFCGIAKSVKIILRFSVLWYAKLLLIKRGQFLLIFLNNQEALECLCGTSCICFVFYLSIGVNNFIVQ